MAFELRWTEDASLSFDEQIGYVASEFGERTARKVYASLVEHIELLRLHPFMGTQFHNAETKGHQFRILHEKKVSVIYEVIEDIVLIVYIWNNRMNLDSLKDVLQS